MPQIKSWEVSDAFWAKVEPLISFPERSADRLYLRKPGGGRKRCAAADLLRHRLRVAHRLPMEGSSTRVWQRQCCTFAFSEVAAAGFFLRCGKPDWLSTTRWKPLHGIGRVSTARCTKRHLRPNAWPTHGSGKKWAQTKPAGRRIGVPLSIVASGANTHDVKLLEATLDQLVMEMPGRAGQYNLCADAGYKGAPASNAVVERNYRPHIKQRREEAHEKLTIPGFKARRWSWRGRIHGSTGSANC